MILVDTGLKEKIGKKILDWCEALPRFNGGTIARLQKLREWERQDSRSAFDRTRPPAGIEFEFIGIQMVEVFNLENLFKLENGIKDVFSDHHKIKDVLGVIEKAKGKLTGGFWSHVGTLTRKEGFFVRPFRIIPNLPSQVRSIEIELFRFLPSLYVITFDIELERSVTEDFKSIINQHHLPKTVFKSVLPWRMWKSGYSRTFVDSVILNKLSTLIYNLRLSIEKQIRPYFQGYFSSSLRHYEIRLPCMELFLLKTEKNNLDALVADEKYQRWFYTIGFDSIDFRSYKDESYLLITPKAEDNFISTFKIFALGDSILSKIDVSQYDGDERSAISFHFEEKKHAIVKGYTFLYLFMILRTNLENNRLRILRHTNSKFRSSLKKVIKLSASLQSTANFFDTIRREFHDNKNWVLGELNALSSNVRKRLNQGSEITMKDNLSESIDYQIAFLANHVKEIKNSFDEHLSIRNMEVMFILQRRIFWLTLVVTVATLLTIIKSNEIKDFVYLFVRFLQSN